MWGNPNRYRGPRPHQYSQQNQWNQRPSYADRSSAHMNNFQQEGNHQTGNIQRYPGPPGNYSYSKAPNEQTVDVMVDSLLKTCRDGTNTSIPPPQHPPPIPYMGDSGLSGEMPFMHQGNQFSHPPPMFQGPPSNHNETMKQNLPQKHGQSWGESYGGGLQLNHQQLPMKNTNNYQTQEPKILPEVKTNESNNQRQEDEKWVLDWIVKKNIMMRKKTDYSKKICHTLKVPEICVLLQEAYSLVRQMRVQTETLRKEVFPNEEWDKEYLKTLQIKERLQNIQKDLNPDAISNFLRKLKNIKKKRTRIRQRRKEAFQQKQDAAIKREKRNEMIDEWRANILQRDLDIKMEKEVKKAADKTLAEVRKKIQEANNGLEVLQGLQKLRELRKDAAQRKGIHTSKDLDVAFEENISEMKSLLEKQLATYENEKLTLEVMLENEQEENKEKENELLKQKLSEKQKEIEAQTRDWLFGPKKSLRADDPLHSFKKFYSGAEQSLEIFLHTRHDWDMFLVQDQTPGGSKIPPGWVVPVEPSDQIWASALKINQT